MKMKIPILGLFFRQIFNILCVGEKKGPVRLQNVLVFCFHSLPDKTFNVCVCVQKPPRMHTFDGNNAHELWNSMK